MKHKTHKGSRKEFELVGLANICEDALTDLIINWQRDQELGHV